MVFIGFENGHNVCKIKLNWICMIKKINQKPNQVLGTYRSGVCQHLVLVLLVYKYLSIRGPRLVQWRRAVLNHPGSSLDRLWVHRVAESLNQGDRQTHTCTEAGDEQGWTVPGYQRGRWLWGWMGSDRLRVERVRGPARDYTRQKHSVTSHLIHGGTRAHERRGR